MDLGPPVPPPLPDSENPRETARRAGWWPIVRDVLIVFLFTAAGGFVVGLAGGLGLLAEQTVPVAIGASNLILGIVAFAYCGVRAGRRRWPHLVWVGVGTWIVSLVNMLIMPLTVAQWFAGSFFIALMMGVGGGLSQLLRPVPPR